MTIDYFELIERLQDLEMEMMCLEDEFFDSRPSNDPRVWILEYRIIQNRKEMQMIRNELYDF